MKRTLSMLVLLMIAGCTWQSRNNHEVNISAPILADQRWQITEVKKIADMQTCTVSAGEIDVTQKRSGDAITSVVSVAEKLNPGYMYRIFVGDHRYETKDQEFRPAMSKAIIEDFRHKDIVYTELVEKTPSRMSGYVRHNNKIELGGFYDVFWKCTEKLQAK